MTPIEMRFVNVLSAVDLLAMKIQETDPTGYLGQVLENRFAELNRTIQELRTTVEERESA
jgi:hypothetical protein